MVIRDCLAATGVHPSELRLSGGGTTSPMFCQMVVDVTGVSAQRVASSELTCRGAALYALLTLGDLSAPSGWDAPAADRWSPDPARSTFYTSHFTEFLRLREIARQGWRSETTPTGSRL
jgi:xylulokinase